MSLHGEIVRMDLECHEQVWRQMEAYSARNDLSIVDATNHAMTTLGLSEAEKAKGNTLYFVPGLKMQNLLDSWTDRSQKLIGRVIELDKICNKLDGEITSRSLPIIETARAAYNAYLASNKKVRGAVALARGVYMMLLAENGDLASRDQSGRILYIQIVKKDDK
jgi:hypothetical protein